MLSSCLSSFPVPCALPAVRVARRTKLFPGTHTVMVMPFENQSTLPGWSGSARPFPKSCRSEWSRPALRHQPRRSQLRLRSRRHSADGAAFAGDHLPRRRADGRGLRRAGQLQLRWQAGSAPAQLLDMKKLHLYPAVHSSGALTNLIDLQTALAWELLQQMPAPPPMTREQFLKASAPIRLDAFENYIRGILATDQQQKIRYLRTALKLNPNYTLAMLQLGKTYYDNHEYESAASWFSRVPKDDPVAGEANFLLGMSEFYRGNFEKSFAARSTSLLPGLPLTEVYNNLGVVEARRGRRASAVEYFSKAVNADPNDADYRFNLAVGAVQERRQRRVRRASCAKSCNERAERRRSQGAAGHDQSRRTPPPPSIRMRLRPPATRCCRQPAAHSAGAHQAQLRRGVVSAAGDGDRQPHRGAAGQNRSATLALPTMSTAARSCWRRT